MNSDMIVGKDVRVEYGYGKDRFQAVDGVSVTVARDEIVALMGPSGCGKSTLLKVLAGIQPCTSGQVVVEGRDVTGVYPKELKERLGFIFQDINLLYWYSVEKNLTLPLEMFGLYKDAKYQARVDEMLELVGLERFKHSFPRELSGGMQQRVGIARSLVHDPDMLIMDEPFGALDEITKGILRFKFFRHFKETHKSVMLVTNSIEEALILSDRIYVMSPAPASIIAELKVDIHADKRVPGIEHQEEYKRMYSQLAAIVMSEDQSDTVKEG